MNPFVQLAKKYPQDAKQIALAFVVSHGMRPFSGMEQVEAVLRYARRVGKLRDGDFLMSPIFKPWHTKHGYDFESSQENFEELQSLAHDFFGTPDE